MAKQRGVVLGKDEIEALSSIVHERGRQAAARELALSDDTLARAAAGFPVNPSTAELIRLKLDLEDGDE